MTGDCCNQFCASYSKCWIVRLHYGNFCVILSEREYGKHCDNGRGLMLQKKMIRSGTRQRNADAVACCKAHGCAFLAMK